MRGGIVAVRGPLIQWVFKAVVGHPAPLELVSKIAAHLGVPSDRTGHRFLGVWVFLPDFSLRWLEFVSALQKLYRRKMTGQAKALLSLLAGQHSCWMRSVAVEDVRRTKALLTNLFNRLCIIPLEDSCPNINRLTRYFVHLCVARQNMLEKNDLQGTLARLHQALDCLHPDKRGRLGSMWGAVARGDQSHQLLCSLNESTVKNLQAKQMELINKGDFVSFTLQLKRLQGGEMSDDTKQLMIGVLRAGAFKPLFMDKREKYFKWYLWCYFVVSKQIMSEEPSEQPSEQMPEELPEELPTKQALTAIGVYDKQHTGNHAVDNSHFWRVGASVTDPILPEAEYEAWQDAYVLCNQRAEALKKEEATQKRLQNKKRKQETPPCSPVARLANSEVKPQGGASRATGQESQQVGGLRLLGFKNLTFIVKDEHATVINTMLMTAGMSLPGTFYFKFGEDDRTNHYHEACTELMASVPELNYGQQTLVLPLRDDALPLLRDLLGRAHDPNRWRQSAEINLTRKFNKGKRHAILEPAFDPEWLRLSDVYKTDTRRLCGDDAFLHSLLCNLIFCVFVGKGDVNAFNMMIRGSQVRSVDFGPAKDLTLHSKPCLVPCQTQRVEVNKALVGYITSNPMPVADYIDRLLTRLLPLPGAIDRPGLARVHHSLRALRDDLTSGSARAEALFRKQ